MATITKKQFCEKIYSLLADNNLESVQLLDDRFCCEYKRERTNLTQSIIKSCDRYNIPYRIETNDRCVSFVVEFD